MLKPSIILTLMAATVLPWLASGQSSDPVGWTGPPDELLRFQIAQVISEAKPGRRARAVEVLQEFAQQAEKLGDRESWADSQLGLARLSLAAAGNEWLEVEPLAVLEELLDRAERGRWNRIRIEALRLHSECLAEGDQPLAAARELELAASVSFASNMHGSGVESLADAARVYRNLGHAAQVRQIWSLIDLAMNQRSAQINQATRELIAKARIAASPALALTPPPSEPLKAGVDFQPLDSGVVVSTSAAEDGRAKFLIINHSSYPAEGVLTVHSGQAEVTSWRGGTEGQLILLHPAVVPKMERRRISLLPGERVRLFLEYAPRHDHAAFSDSVSLVWTDSKGDQPTRCTFQFRNDIERTSSVVNSSRLQSRPAWPVPVYHEIFFRGGSSQIENVLTIASVPCRLEIYDEDSGSLVAIDAEGDGVFTSPGDLLPPENDRDQDGRPDLVVSAEASVRSLEIYAFPHQSGGQMAEISLHLADYSVRPARWRKEAVDQVAP